MKTARLCLIDTIGCGLEGLRVDPQCAALMEPIVEVSPILPLRCLDVGAEAHLSFVMTASTGHRRS